MDEKELEGFIRLINLEIDKRMPKAQGMDDAEKQSSARDYREICHQNLEFASRRGSELSDEFNRLEVQIATLLFAAAGLFLPFFKGNELVTLSHGGIQMMKLAFALSIFFLGASLICGLLHIKRKEMFWDGILRQRNKRFEGWDLLMKRQLSFEEGVAFQSGTTRSSDGIVTSPRWPWVLQTIFLGVAIFIQLALALVFLYQ